MASNNGDNGARHTGLTMGENKSGESTGGADLTGVVGAGVVAAAAGVELAASRGGLPVHNSSAYAKN